MNIVFSLELQIASKNAQLQIISKAFAEGHLEQDEKVAFEEYVMSSFKNNKTALIKAAKVQFTTEGNAFLTDASCSCTCQVHNSVSLSSYPGPSRAAKVSNRGPSTSVDHVTHTQKEEESSASSPETTTKKRNSSNSCDHIDAPVDTPSPADPFKRKRYRTNYFSPSNPGNIRDTAEYTISHKLRQESAVIAEAARKVPPAWKKKRAEGFGIHVGQRVYVNPTGRGYKAKCNPVLGEDFFLDPRDVLAYLAHFEVPTAEIAIDAPMHDGQVEQPEQAPPSTLQVGTPVCTPEKNARNARTLTQVESPAARTQHHEPETVDAHAPCAATKEATNFYSCNAFDTDIDNDDDDVDLESDFEPVLCGGPSSLARRAPGEFTGQQSSDDGTQSDSENERGSEERKSPTTHCEHTIHTEQEVSTSVASGPSARSVRVASVMSYEVGALSLLACAPSPMSVAASPMCRPNFASMAPRHSAEGIRLVPQLAHPQVAVKVEPAAELGIGVETVRAQL